MGVPHLRLMILAASAMTVALSAWGAEGGGGGAWGGRLAHPYLVPHFERCIPARRVSGIRVDGKIDENWGPVPELSGFYHDSKKEIVNPRTHVRVAYDSANVYFLLRCDEGPGYKYRVSATGKESPSAWQDDCVEIYIDPAHLGAEFYQFIVNAGGAWGQNHLDRPWKCGWRRAAKRSESGWVAELSIPISALGVKVKHGTVWGINITRNRPGAAQHSSFSPIIRGHKAAGRFQQIVFAGALPKAGAESLARKVVESARAAWKKREKARLASYGPAYEAKPGELKLAKGGTFRVGGRKWRVVELANHRNVRPKLPFCYESFDRPEWKRLRDGYDYDEYVGRAKDDFETALRLRSWVNRKIPYSRRPDKSNMDLFDLLDKALKEGKKFYCWHQSQIYVQLAGSLGLNARVIGLPSHVSNEIWLDRFGKWAWMDSTLDLHFEKGGVPLSVVEMRREWHRNKFRDVRLLKGLKKLEVYHDASQQEAEEWRRNYKSYFYNTRKRPGQRFKYEWIYVTFANDFFAHKREHSPALMCLLRDPVTEKALKSEAGAAAVSGLLRKFGPGGVSHLNVAAEDYEWTLNTSTIHLRPAVGGAVEARLETFTPNFDTFLVRTDGGKWSKSGAVFPWKLHAGRNILEVKVRNRFGREGRTSKVVLASD